MTIVNALLILGGMGALCGLILSVAGKVFYVEKDPREDEIMEIIPSANCGACGFSGCSGYARAVVSGEAAVGLCPVGGQSLAEDMAKIMGVAVDPNAERLVAQVRCTGSGLKNEKFEYGGIHDCAADMNLVGGGHIICKHGCLGLGTCVRACPYDAITINEATAAVVNPDKCKGCMICVTACPKSLFQVVPYQANIKVLCASRDKGVVVRQACENGCIGCGLCVKACPHGAMRVEDNLAQIDYTKCVSCGLCVSSCPRKIIYSNVGDVKPEAV